MGLKKSVMKDIENARREMFLISKKYPLTSSEVVTASQKLDRLMNKHSKLNHVYEK
ncbi:aspartyl-phosphate phosphatase Spo0E family protein (plasmid) [Rossellomorea sp. AcN35-11]|nr:aspartyl-phosphate phosphatase Spo0E family protein [Rossellomorea aquimaris]WJV32233.1 aspartyl-phosphate phosphatase Spo0E family protein [Rossellomorea sp. AcN35-11]